MNLDFQAGASPLAARANPAIYTAIFIALIVVAIFLVIALILKFFKERQDSPEWQESQKNRVTKKKDVAVFAEKHGLTEAEKNILWKICSKYKIQNINFALKEQNSLEEYFKAYYDEQKLNGNEKEINKLFNIKFRIEKIASTYTPISSTKALTAKQDISEIFPDGSKRRFSVYENKKDWISIEIPQDFYNSQEKPAELEKVAFIFKSPSGMRYAFISRVIRYEKTENSFLMIIPHSHDLIMKQQRNFKRLLVAEKCKIASVYTETGKKGETIFKHAEQTFDCQLTNISGGGCCISTTLPVKEGQLTYISFELPSGECNAIGKIVKTRRTKNQGVFNLHIKFREISLEAQNKILAKVYGYN